VKYTVISEVSKLLRQTLWDGFDGDVDLTSGSNAPVPNIDAIVLRNPADAATDAGHRLSIWLYQVQQNEYLRNQPQERVPGDDTRQRFPPLSINLFYLLTPFTGSDDSDQMVLGRSMQIFHDNAILLLESAEEPGKGEELRIMMSHRDLRELAEVWEALQQPYRLSVCYEVRVPQIDSLRLEQAKRIGDRRFHFDEDVAGVQGVAP